MKIIPLQYSHSQIEISVPDNAHVLCAAKVEPLANPSAEVLRSLKEPIAARPLHQLARGRQTAAIVVSDNTRPIPYKGPDGILPDILKILRQSRVNNIKIIVGCGTHRPMSEPQLRHMLGDEAFGDGIEVINHMASDESMLCSIGRTERTPNVTVNRHYINADLKIVTGLVEPHFMAGFSGGRKAICPGICGRSVTFGFHSAPILNEKEATSLVLGPNPCHQEALRIARMAGVDFTINLTLDSNKRITGVFSGHLEKSHQAAVEHLCTFAMIGLNQIYDVVITQAGVVGMNHYQCAKAVFEAARALKPGGRIILLANLTDAEPVGSQNYRDILRLLTRLGPEDFIQKILANDWTFVPDQWQVQMWAKTLQKLDSPKHLYTCAAQLEGCPDDLVPEVNVASEIRRFPGECDVDFARRMTQQTIDNLIKNVPDEKILVLPDGPYAVPILREKFIAS